MAQDLIRVTAGRAAGATIEINGEVTFGRNPGNNSLQDDPEISRSHARITRANGGLRIDDLGSTNGTFVNGRQIDAATPLSPGDVIAIGGSTLEVSGVGSRNQPTQAGAPTPAFQPTRAMQTPPVAAAAGGSPGGAATAPPAGPPRTPLGGAGAGAAPAHPATAGGGKSRGPLAAVIAAVVGLLVGGAIAAAIFEGDESSAAEPVERFSLMAQGFSEETLDPNTGQREIVIIMRTFEAPHGIEELRVHKFLDETTPPPQRTYDAIYTFTAQNGDTLVLNAAGDVTEPQGPDRTLGQTFEQWRVVNGTGIFEGARGEGTVTTAVAVASRGPRSAPTGSDVVKHIQGTLELNAD